MGFRPWRNSRIRNEKLKNCYVNIGKRIPINQGRVAGNGQNVDCSILIPVLCSDLSHSYPILAVVYEY